MPVLFSPNTKSNEFKIYAGEAALDGSNPTPVITPLHVVLGATLSLKNGTAPGVGTSVLTYALSGSTVNVFAWQPTSSANPTLVASPGNEVFSYVIVGY
jgi:hypothetical protein